MQQSGTASQHFSQQTWSSIGGDNGGDCINELYDQCNKAKNGGSCENYNSACSKSTNRGGCLNTTLKRLQKSTDTGLVALIP